MARRKVVVQKKDRLKRALAAARSTGNLPNGSWKCQVKAAYRKLRDASR